LQKPSTVSNSTPNLAETDSSATDSSTALGTLYGIGVGPGDPELITVKALNCLRTAQVVAFPAGLNQQPGVAERSIERWLCEQQQRLPLTFPYVQDPAQLKAAWQTAAEQVWPHLQQGDVVFACEGDISFYSTFTYLAEALQQQHAEAKIEAIAGISSPMAAAAALGIPLTSQADKLAVLPALYTVSQLESVLAWADVVVLMKVSSVYAQVWKVLKKHHLLEQSYVVENATRSNQITYAGLNEQPNLTLPYFSIMIVKCT